MMDISLKDAKILIVDDQQANLDMLVGLLEFKGYSNLKAITDPRLVHGLMESFNPDIILLDLLMPYLTGFEVMEDIKKIVPEGEYFPILVLTADMTIQTKQRALANGAKDFLVKPFDLIEASLRINILLEARYLHQQLENQNKLLEEKVWERTMEVVGKNVELEAAREKAEASDRLKTAFMQNISHEVRTPLNGIVGFGNLLAEADLSSEDRKLYISLLKVSSNRLVNTMTDYMDIALIASSSMEVHRKAVNIVDILKELESKFQNQIGIKKLTFELKIPWHAEEFFIETDPELFRKILSHLLDNAIKFTQQGSITLGYSFGSDKLEFFITDTGVGISDEKKDMIFESFIQENSEMTRGYEGSGLGLSIITGILRLLGGEIRVESAKGEGTSFFFTLPVQPGFNDFVEGGAAGLKNESPLIPVFLVADDEYAHRVYMESFLKKIASVIFLAKNGREAVDLIHEHSEISMVLMDLKMPVMDGFEATKEIKSFRKDLPVIAVTAYAMSGDEKRAYDCGCDDYIVKPTSIEELLLKLKKFGIGN